MFIWDKIWSYDIVINGKKCNFLTSAKNRQYSKRDAKKIRDTLKGTINWYKPIC